MELIKLENREGKRLQKTPPAPRKPPARKKGPKIAAAVLAVVFVGAAAAYTGLCAWVSTGRRIYPNTTVLGSDLSGMTAGQAGEAVQEALSGYMAGRTITLTEAGTGHTATLSCDIVSAKDFGQALSPALPEGFFLGQGASYLKHLAFRTELTPALALSESGRQALNTVVDQLSAELDHPVVETAYEISNGNLLLTKGITGSAIDTAALEAGILDALTEDVEEGSGDKNLEVEVSLMNSPPSEPDFEAIHDQVYVEPADAYLDKESKQIVESVTGVSFDIASARSALDSAGEGTAVQVPLTYTEPDLSASALSKLLFRDVLASSTTYCSGNSNRLANIKTAAKKINGMILLAGETFSYNDEVGPYTTASGYLPAGTYQGGKSVDALAGGICQLSSTLYWSTLKANLEINERHNHQLTVGYLPDGCDATVYGGGPDFKFTNNTEQPLKIQATMDGRNLTVKLVGTNTTGLHAQVETVRVSTDPMRVIYKADSSIPAGSAPQRDPAYPGHNGTVVKAYRVVYDANNNEVSRTLESTNRYARQDKVYLYHPNDAAALGIDPSTGTKTQTPVTPTPSASPSAAPAPSTEPTPSPSTEPSPAVPPETTPTPPAVTPSAPPVQSQEPVSSEPPVSEPPAPVDTPAPTAETSEPPASTPEPPASTPEPPASTSEPPASTPEPPAPAAEPTPVPPPESEGLEA